MSENPYASYPSNRDNYGTNYDDRPQRLSIPAVLSLVSSIVCCIPGMGVLGVLLGLLAMWTITRSEGRLTGMPAAVIGMALGVLVTVGWVVTAMGAGSAYNMWQVNITRPMANFVEAAYAGDVTAARTELSVSAQGLATDEEILNFAAALRSEFGGFQGPPASVRELIQGVWEGFARSQNSQAGSSNQAIPSTLYFDKGAIAIFGVIDAGTGGQPSQQFQFADFFVLLPNAEALTFRDDGPAVKEAIRLNFTPISSTEFLERAAHPATPPAAPTPPAPAAPPMPDAEDEFDGE